MWHPASAMSPGDPLWLVVAVAAVALILMDLRMMRMRLACRMALACLDRGDELEARLALTEVDMGVLS